MSPCVRPRLLLALLFLHASGMPPRSLAQEAGLSREPDVPEKAGKELRAFRIETSPPTIDGRLDDAVWMTAMSIDDFVQEEPDNMEAPTERTVVQVAYDDEYLYVAVRAYMEDAALISAGLGRRDNFPPSDRFALQFDPRHDHLTGYVFETNPSGVEADYILLDVDDTRTNFDYDAVWEVNTEVTTEGWTAEFRIPFAQMRFDIPPGDETVWGFQVRRDIYERAERSQWVAAPRRVRGNVSRFGHLVFNDRLSPPGRLEVMPFMLGRSEHLAEQSSGQTADGGIDLRYGLGSSATLSVTVNPDFGQVEQDPAVLNLSVFETFFPENRPFFIEDARTFIPPYRQFPLFYSRRIGQRPGRFALEEGDELVSRPDRTTILGAAKVTGVGGDWTYGGLTTLTAREYAVVDHTTTGVGGEESTSRMERLIEPRTSYHVGRLQRNILGGSSNIGLIGTAVVREKDLNAYTGGVDADLRWSQNRYRLSNFWVLTRAPIAGELQSGFAGFTRFSFVSRNLELRALFDHISRNFRNTDAGFLVTRVNKTQVRPRITLIQPDPWRGFRRVSVAFWGDDSWNGNGLRIRRFAGSDFSIQFLNYWTLNFNVAHVSEVFSDLRTRGGPPIIIPEATRWFARVGSDSRRSWGLSASGFAGRDVEGGWFSDAGVGIQIQPSARLQAEMQVRYNAGRDIAQWITNRDVNDDGETDYVFGELRRDVLDVRVRGTFAFTRDMTLEVYLQPFVSVGHYTDIKRLARPKSFDFESATLPFNPDFSRRSLRGNVVLRWEYLGGSTLYLVWQITGVDRSDPGVFEPWEDFANAFGGPQNNIFMLKTTYWLGL